MIEGLDKVDPDTVALNPVALNDAARTKRHRTPARSSAISMAGVAESRSRAISASSSARCCRVSRSIRAGTSIRGSPSPTRPATSGWKSAPGAASTSSRPPPPIRTSASSAASRSSTAWPGRWPISLPPTSTTSGCSAATPGSSSTGCLRRALGRVFLFYPDPWPKRRQRKRRFLSDDMLTRLARVMRAGAELRFATDIDDKCGWTLARLLRSPDFTWTATCAADWQAPWPGWVETRYEHKAKAAGRRPCYITAIRR